MKKLFFLLISVAAIILISGYVRFSKKPEISKGPVETVRKVEDTVRGGETFYDIFKRHKLDMGELDAIKKASSGVFNLGKVRSGRQYNICVDGKNRIRDLNYFIDDDCYAYVKRTPDGFSVQKVSVEYEKEVAYLSGTIKDNLVSSMDSLTLALDLSDIFAWDIDFTTDLRNGDRFLVAVEELWLDGQFRKYKNILSAEFVNNGEAYRAYRFESGGEADYYDEQGRTLRRAFLKAPLTYRNISSRFSKSRFHPVLKIYRPHLGVDYAAEAGTPVSSVGDGTVEFAGYKGQNGKIVVIRHPGGYTTYYGHLSRIQGGVRNGGKVRQGETVGYVGSTGLSTGPHLDYRIKKNGRFINPLTLKMPRRKALTGSALAEFTRHKGVMDERMASYGKAALGNAAGKKSKDSVIMRDKQARL